MDSYCPIRNLQFLCSAAELWQVMLFVIGLEGLQPDHGLGVPVFELDCCSEKQSHVYGVPCTIGAPMITNIIALDS